MNTPLDRFAAEQKARDEKWSHDTQQARLTQQYAMLQCSQRRYQVIKYFGISRYGGEQGPMVQRWEAATKPLSFEEALDQVRELNK